MTTSADTLNAVGYGPQWAARWDEENLRRPNTEDSIHSLYELAAGQPVLEFGIGTGRLALPLLEKGLKVSGIENSPHMIAQLTAKCRADEITVVEGDFASTRVDGEFGLVFISSHALSALVTQDLQVQCFRNAAAHLNQGGRFAIEVMSPLSDVLENGRAWTTGVRPNSVSMFLTSTNWLTQQMTTCALTLTDSGEVRMRPAASRFCYPSELDLMGQLAGLRLRDRWSGWDQQPFTDKCAVNVSVYEKE